MIKIKNMLGNNYDTEMLNHSDSYENDYDEATIEKIEFGEECGLSFQKELSDDGSPIFLGDNRAWDYFNNGGKY